MPLPGVGAAAPKGSCTERRNVGAGQTRPRPVAPNDSSSKTAHRLVSCTPRDEHSMSEGSSACKCLSCTPQTCQSPK